MPSRRRKCKKLSRKQRKARQQRTIRKHKPWQHSTGPKSFLGQKTVSQNALKHGLRSRWFSAQEKRAFTTLMRNLRRNGVL
jgi:hypothetical protein